MIRDRRNEDIGRLVEILTSMSLPPGLRSAERAAWLQGPDPVLSWVFDMAPVSVAPTDNVVAHLQVRRPADAPPAGLSEAHVGQEPAEMLVIEKLFVRPGTHTLGIARFLLRESVRVIRGQGKLPVLDHAQSQALPDDFLEGCGFQREAGAVMSVHRGGRSS